jgi:S-DNA-T family DNA segregation ATPase FtsK/SpoIIIE
MTGVLWTLVLVVFTFLAFNFRVYRFVVPAVRRDWATCRSVGRLIAIHATWNTLARELDLVTRDRAPVQTRGVGLSGQVAEIKSERILKTPRIKGSADRYGVKIVMRTTPGVGLVEVQKSARHLADAWHCVRVAVTQPRAGRVLIRAVRVDPLVTATSMDVMPPAPASLDSVPVGLDEYAEEVALRLKGISGVGVFGLSGYGKTSLVRAVVARLCQSSCVQFVVLDGKADEADQGDYGDFKGRFLHLGGDDLEDAGRVLEILVKHRKDRANRIRAELNTNDIWTVGFSERWPLIVVIIDEAHTYFNRVPDGGDKLLKARNAQAAMNAMHVEDLVKKGRAVGIVTFLLTQKGTGDAIPTQIRDVCTVSLCFAVRTTESAVAALGEDIKLYPESSPLALQDPAYIGVAVMKVADKPGFTRVRMPFVSEEIVAQAVQESIARQFEVPGEVVPVLGHVIQGQIESEGIDED